MLLARGPERLFQQKSTNYYNATQTLIDINPRQVPITTRHKAPLSLSIEYSHSMMQSEHELPNEIGSRHPTCLGVPLLNSSFASSHPKGLPSFEGVMTWPQGAKFSGVRSVTVSLTTLGSAMFGQRKIRNDDGTDTLLRRNSWEPTSLPHTGLIYQ